MTPDQSQDFSVSNAARPKKPKPRFRSILARMLLLLGGVWLAVCLMLVAFQRKLVFVGHSQRVAQPLLVTALEGAAGRAFDIRIPVEGDIELNGWIVLAKPAESIADGLSAKRPVVLYCGGNAGNRLKRARAIQLLTDIGADVFITDYRGYADNDGAPSEEAFARDAMAKWTYLTDQLQVAPDRIVVFGESLGGGVATRLTAELCDAHTPPAGLILRATFASLVETAAYHYPFVPVRLVLKDRFPSVERMPRVTCPIIHFHGKRDRIVPYMHGKELFAAAPDRSATGVQKEFVALPEAGHNDILWVAYDEVQNGTQQFLKRIDLLPSSSPTD